MSITLVANAINTFVDARCTLAVIEATAPNDRPRIERAKLAALRASNALANVLLAFDHDLQHTFTDDILPAYRIIGHMLTALDALSQDNKPAQDAINAARSVVNINVKEQTH